MAGQGLADQAQRAHIEGLKAAAVGLWHHKLKPAAGPEAPQYLLAGRVDIDIGTRFEGRHLLRRPGVALRGQHPVLFLKEGPVEKAFIGHQSPLNTGFSFFTKAS